MLDLLGDSGQIHPAILVVVYHCLKDGVIYQDPGANYFEKINREAMVKRTVRRLQKLG